MKVFNIIATSLLGTAMAIGTGFALANKQNMKQAKADATTFDVSLFSGAGTAESGSEMSKTSNGMTITFDKGYGAGAADVRSYAGGNITFSADFTFTTITITATGSADNRTGGTWTVNSGGGSVSKNSTVITWTGSTNSLSLHNASQLRMASLTFDTSGGGGVDPDPDPVTDHAGTAADPYSVADAIAITPSDSSTLTNKYVKGYIVGTPNINTSYGNATFNIADAAGGSPTFNIFRTMDIGGGKITDANRVKEGDLVVVCGTLKTYNSTKELADGALISIESSGGSVTEHAGTAADPYSVADAIAVTPASGTLTGKYVKGVVVGTPNIDTGDYGNATFDVADVAGGSPTFNIFRVKDIGNEKFTDANKIKAGYTVVVYGDLKTYNSTKELTSGYVISITEGEAPEPETAETIQEIYSCNKGDNVDVHGYYVGFLTGTGPIIMDGEYGVVIFNKDLDVTSYTENETKLHVTGTIDIYNGLYEVKNATITSSSATIAAPVTYTVTGSETYIHESRLTFVTGTVVSITPKTEGDYWTSDTTVVMSVNSKQIQCFAKANALDSVTGGKIQTALSNSTSITLTGFTGWFTNFQVTLTGVHESSGSYSLSTFITDFNNETNAICSTYVDGTSDYATFKTQLQGAWSRLNSEDKYQDLSDDDKQTLRTETASNLDGASALQKMLARYEFLVGKYQLGDFLERGLGSSSNKFNIVNSNNVAAVIIVTTTIAVVSLTGVFFIIRKRKHQ